MPTDKAQLTATKSADTRHDIHELIRKRWSPRAFSEDPIPQEELEALLEAASWAASSYNEQPWEYFYAHRSNKKGFQLLLSCLKPGNQEWAAQAAVLLVSVARTSFSKNDRPNRHYMHDAGAANTTMMLEAASRDIYGHMMAGFDYEKTEDEFELNMEQEPVCFIALGYLGDPEQLKEPLRSREQTSRNRKPLSEFTTQIL
mgnify:CR=1 FL=1